MRKGWRGLLQIALASFVSSTSRVPCAFGKSLKSARDMAANRPGWPRTVASMVVGVAALSGTVIASPAAEGAGGRPGISRPAVAWKDHRGDVCQEGRGRGDNDPNHYLVPGPEFSPGNFYAIGVTTPNADETAARYQSVFGVIPKSFGSNIINHTPDGGLSGLAMDVAFFQNFYVKLQQPTNDVGPYAPWLDRYGTSIMNFQIFVSDAQAVRATLQEQGAIWTLSDAADPWAYIDLKRQLGFTLETEDSLLTFPVAIDPAASLPLGAMPPTHVGIAVADVAEAAKAYSKFFGIPTPAISNVHGVSPDGKPVTLCVAGWQQGRMGIELVESAPGPTPWNEFVRENGDGAMSLGFDVGDQLHEFQDDLLAKGGKLIFKTRDGAREYVEFPGLGLVIELDGSPGGGYPGHTHH